MNLRHRTLLSLFALLPAVTHASTAASNDTAHSTIDTMKLASGTLHFDNQKESVGFGYYRLKESDNGPVVVVLLSSHALPLRALNDRQKLTSLARKGAFLGLGAEIDAEGNLQQSELYYDDGAFSGPWKYEPTKGKSAGPAGKIATEGAGEFFGRAYEVNVTFKFATKPTADWQGSPFYQPSPTGLPSGTAAGWMERKGKKTTFTHAVVLQETNLFGDSGERSILLTTAPVTDAMLSERRGPEQALVTAGHPFLRATVDAQGDVQSVMYPVDGDNVMTLSSTQFEAEFSKVTPQVLEGTIAALDERDAQSEFPRFEARFHGPVRVFGSAAPVTKENGEALPKDGGAPGQAVRDFNKVLKNAKTVEELLPYRIPALVEQVKSVPPERRSAMLAFLKEQGANPPKIVGGFANAQQATLWLEGKQDGEPMIGRVNVHLIDGVWKLGAESYRIGNTVAN